MASQAECRRFDPDRPLHRTLSAKAFAKLVELELARLKENEGRTVAGRGAQTATRLPRAVPGMTLCRVRAERSILERARKVGEKRRVRLVRLAGEVVRL